VSRLLLVHWNEAEAAERARRLRAIGHRVTCFSDGDATNLRELRADPPDAFLIDLARLPSHGRAVAVALRQSQATRDVPLVFLEGDAAKTARVRELLPDATFATWRGVRGALAKALKAPGRLAPIVPKSISGYSGTPLPGKLGVRAGDRVRLLDAPVGFEALLGALPEGAQVARGARGSSRVVLWFVDTRAGFARGFARAAKSVEDGGRLWVCWPKQTSPLARDLNGDAVREGGLERGWVDFKVCALDADWSGLAFARSKS
jgi:CheY-like chemotaxis protein